MVCWPVIFVTMSKTTRSRSIHGNRFKLRIERQSTCDAPQSGGIVPQRYSTLYVWATLSTITQGIRKKPSSRRSLLIRNSTHRQRISCLPASFVQRRKRSFFPMQRLESRKKNGRARLRSCCFAPLVLSSPPFPISRCW
jgi:hypothetical protein